MIGYNFFVKFLKPAMAHWPIVVVVIIASVLRFWRLEELTTFGGDQGYDFLIVKKILDGDLTLLGPKIGPYNELGNLYLGPAYYYLLAPALFLFRLDPIGPAFLTVIFSLLTIILIYFICIKFFSKTAGVIASGLYATNSLLVSQSRATSNPHLIPMFSALIIFSMLKILKGSDSKIWPILTGVCLGIAFQLHYLAVFLLVSAILTLAIKKHFREILISLVGFFVAVSPQILFELRNDFFVSRLFVKQVQMGSQNLGSLQVVSHFFKSFEKALNIVTGFNSLYFPFITIIFFGTIIILVGIKKQIRVAILFLLLIVATNIIALSFYWGPTETHYLASTYAALFILIGIAVSTVLKYVGFPFLKVVLIIFATQIVAANLMNLNLSSSQGYTMPPGWNLKGIKNVVSIVTSEHNLRNFNIAATLDGDTRAMPYRYLLEVNDKTPQGVEAYPGSEIIYLVARDEEEKIKSYTVWEVSSFAPFKIEKSWEIQNEVNLFTLVKEL
jgi:4-amino-4-deoxy-L-arabinose transferase-like glycosyltransferase